MIIFQLISSLVISKEAPAYQSAKLLVIDVVTVQKNRFAGAPFGNVHFMSGTPYKAYVYQMTIEVEGGRYTVAYEVNSRRDYLPTIQAGDMLEVRTAGETMFIKRPDGNELKTKILPNLTSWPPAQNPTTN